MSTTFPTLPGFEVTFLECQCHTADHLVKLTWDKQDNEIWVEPHLNIYLPWYKRILLAVKYIFGYSGHSYSFDTVVVNPKDFKRLAHVFNCAHMAHLGKTIPPYTTVRQTKDNS